MFVLVAYDVSSTRRRTKVAKILRNYGERVNLSVFECEFRKPEALEKMKGAIKEVIKPSKDHIRYYPVCAECRNKMSVQGSGVIREEAIVKFA